MRNFRDETQRYDPLNQDTYDSQYYGKSNAALFSTTREGIEKMNKPVKQHSENKNLFLNAKKTKIFSLV